MDQQERAPIEIDFAHKATEAQWQQILDEFGAKAAPVWFNWLGWVLLLGAQVYLVKQVHSLLLAFTIVISVGLLYLHFHSFFYRLDFKNVPVVGRRLNKRALSLMISGVVAFASWRAAIWIALIVAEHQS